MSTAMNFASRHRDWAQKQKEDEVKSKEEKEKQRSEENLLHKERERRSKEDEVLRKSGIFGIQVGRKKADSDEEKYAEAYKSENSDDSYLSDDQYADDVYEEEEEEEDCDGNWSQRKHRDEMYWAFWAERYTQCAAKPLWEKARKNSLRNLLRKTRSGEKVRFL